MSDSDTAHSVRVDLGARGYDIVVGPGLLDRAGALVAPLAARPRVFVLSDETVAGLHGNRLAAGLAGAGLEAVPLALPPGEATKSWDSLTTVLDWLLDASADRADILMALGGGVIGDLAGLAAALMKRGMGLVQAPTTLLAQVDSSVGGKTAINTRHGKNLVGAFYQPRLVIADTVVLQTLPERERRAGYAEIVKYGLIDAPDVFDRLEAAGAQVMALEAGPLAHAIAESCRAKSRIVAADEREGGLRALLNLGHTFAHALEAANGYRASLLHGEAVGCGLALAARYSVRLGLMGEGEAQRAERVLAAAGLATRIGDLDGGPYTPADLARLMVQDKKARAGRVPLILMRGIGRAFIHPDADLDDVRSFLAKDA